MSSPLPQKILDHHTPAQFLTHLLTAKSVHDEHVREVGHDALQNLRTQIRTFELHHLQALLAYVVVAMSHNKNDISGLTGAFAGIVFELVLDDMIARTRILAQESDPDAIVGE